MSSSRCIQAGLTGTGLASPAASVLPSRTGSIRSSARPSPSRLERISPTSRPSIVTIVPGGGGRPFDLYGHQSPLDQPAILRPRCQLLADITALLPVDAV